MKRIFLVSDLHLDHKNIIRYCNRPFNSVEEMNRVIVNNWNKTIKPNDIVYFLGDLAFGRGSRNTDYWLKKLNGNIIFIKGNHDRSRRINFIDNMVLKHNRKCFYLTHSSWDVPEYWKGWVISGHHHNNSPLIDRRRKKINVSIEMVDYKPIEINELLEKVN